MNIFEGLLPFNV